MQLYTIQMAQWRKAKAQGILLLDTTVKSGDPVFAPTWEIVDGVKSGRITADEYTHVYRQLMTRSFRIHAARWREVIRGEPVAVACYCAKGKFCHRHLLKDYFQEICHARSIPFEYLGEL